MEALFIAAVVVLIAVILLCRLRPVARWSRNMPYTRRAGLLSRGELAFFRVLVGAVPREVIVAHKMRLADRVAEIVQRLLGAIPAPRPAPASPLPDPGMPSDSH